VHRFVASVTVVLLAVTVGLADEFVGLITKFEDGKITVRQFKKKGDKGTAKTLAVARDCKFVMAKFNKEEKKIEPGEAMEGGKEAFAKRVKAAAKEGGKGFGGGVFAQVITSGEGDDAKVTEIRAFPPFKGKFKKKDAD
jgi:hypothetical protein